MPKSDLPFGSDFSPTSRDLGFLLELADWYGEDWREFERRIRAEYTEDKNTSDRNKDKLANNTKLGMRAYGLIAPDNAALTELGRRLFALRHEPQQMYEEFARDILVNRKGLTLVQCIRDMTAAGEEITGVTIRRELEERGIYVPVNSRNHFTMRLWLEKAGVFSDGFLLNEPRLEEILGTEVENVDALAQLTPEQRAYLRTLANIDSKEPQRSNELAKLTQAAYGVDFKDQGIPKLILYPLRDAGFITVKRGTAQPGRGAKPFLVEPTDLVRTELLEPFLKQIDEQVLPDLRPWLRRPLSEIRADVNSRDRHVRGLALEALAFKLMRLINLDYVTTRLRGAQTGGAEVDLIFESTGLIFNRWQVQCKNSKRVSLEDVAKEVGLTLMLKSNAIVMVTTGEVGREARRYATEVMRKSNLCIMMVNGADLQSIEANPASLADILTREAKNAMQVKALQMDGGN